MVATRQSLPSAAESSSPPVPTDRKALLALKKLQVDGTDALRSGQLPSRQPTSSPAVGQTYNWRGSVYAVTGNEPEEWLTPQPRRDKQSSSTPAAEEPEPATVRATGKRKRQEDDEEEEEEKEAAPPKQQKRSPPKGRSPAKRSSPPKARRQRPPPPSEEEGRMQRARMYDYTRIAQPSEYSCAEAARRAAHLNGYAINPISKKEIASQVSRNVKNKVIEIAKINDQMADSIRKWRNTKYAWLCSRTPEHLHETNEEIVKLKKQIDDDEELPMTAVKIISKVTNPPACANSSSPTTTSPPAPLDPSAPSPESLTPGAPNTPGDEPLIFPVDPKGTQKLRWRAPKGKADTPTSARAENAIRRERIDLESRSARRRRIKRELALVRAWPVEEGIPGTSVDQTSSSQEK